MKKNLIIGLVFLFGCLKDTTRVPDGLLSREEMAKVQTEVHILEARIYKLYLKEDSAKKLYHHYEKMLLDSLNVSEEQYEQSIEYYFTNPKNYQKVYDQVVDTLLSRQKRESNK